MNLKQKVYLTTLIERAVRPISEYLNASKHEFDPNAPEGYNSAMRLADVQVDPEKYMSKIEGACEILELTPVFDKVKKEIRIENKVGKVILWTNGVDCNYDLDDLALKYYQRYGDNI